jgi:predicted nucleic acid-binding protein
MPDELRDLFHLAIACETGADEFLTFDREQADLTRAAGLPVWKWKNAHCT